MSNYINNKKKRSGQAIVEMALVIMPMLMLLFGIIDFGWVMFRKISLSGATREGLRIAAMNNFAGQDKNQARDAIKNKIIRNGTGLRLTKKNISIDVDPSGTATTAYHPQVTITTTLHHKYIGAMQFIGANSIELKSVYRSIVTTWKGNEEPAFNPG